MKLLEHESKALFSTRGIPVPKAGGVIDSPAKLAGALKRLGKGPYVIKAQVLAGGRGKAGGIKVAKTAAEAKAIAKTMLGMKLKTHQTAGQGIEVKEILVEEAAEILAEYYLSVAMDRNSGRPVMIASAQGGVDIEEVARKSPEVLLREPVDPVSGLADFQARKLAFALSVPAPVFGEFVKAAKAVAKTFLELDCSILEINPLAVVKGPRLVALDAKVILDDNALFRHADFQKPDPEASPPEIRAKMAGISYIQLDGSVGCMVNGAGLAMSTMDIIQLAGGSPANFLDVGGGANVEAVRTAFEILLKDKKVKAVLVNIFGGIMKCDVIAQGILDALKKVDLKVPLVVRLEGTRVKEGKALLEKSGIKLTLADGLWDAAQKVVAAARGAESAASASTSAPGAQRGGTAKASP